MRREVQTGIPVFLTSVPTLEALALTQTAEEWPVFNGVPDVTYTVEGETRAFTGGYCRAKGEGSDSLDSEILVISGDETWVTSPLWSGEGIKLTAHWPYDVGPFQIDVQVGKSTYHTSYEQVASLEDRHTALALSADHRSGTFRGKGRGSQGNETVWVAISGSFTCK